MDVAVLFEPEPGPRELDTLTTDLETAARRAVDLVVLNTAPPLLTRQIIKTGQRVVCRAEHERVRFETRAAARYLDPPTCAGSSTGTCGNAPTPSVPVDPEIVRRKLLDIGEAVSRLRSGFS